MRAWLTASCLLLLAAAASAQDMTPAPADDAPQQKGAADGDAQRDQSMQKLNTLMWQQNANQGAAENTPESTTIPREGTQQTQQQRDAADEKWLAKFKEQYEAATPDQQMQMRQELAKQVQERMSRATPQQRAHMREQMEKWREKYGDSGAGRDDEDATPDSPESVAGKR